ncbi:hypothetical protein J7J18_06210 [bacterium]|nr:hypothetical protein [bacterium]
MIDVYYNDDWDISDEEIEELIEKLEKTKDRTEFILKHIKETREDDVLLWFFVNWVFNRDNLVRMGKLILWMNKNFGNRKLPSEQTVKIAKKVLSTIIPEDTISRCRRKIQNEEGKYLPPQPVREDRRYKEDLWRKASKRF